MDPDTIEERIQKFFKKHNKTVEKISFLGKGEGSRVYRIDTPNRTYCMKTALFPKRSKKVLNEAKIRNKFIHFGLTFVPRSLFVDRNTFPHGAVFYDYIDGIKPDFTTKDALAQMAKCLAEIHKLDFYTTQKGLEQIWKNHQFLKEVTESILRRYPHLVNEKIAMAFSKAIDVYKNLIEKNTEFFAIGISSILHGDIGDNCLMDTQGKLWLIDWENSEYGDIIDELSGFVYYAVKDEELQNFFFQEYQKHFKPAREIPLKQLYKVYSSVYPVLNICWGIDQLDSNLIHELEPKRKLDDIVKSARNWSLYYSEELSNLILEGVNEMYEKISKQL